MFDNLSYLEKFLVVMFSPIIVLGTIYIVFRIGLFIQTKVFNSPVKKNSNFILTTVKIMSIGIISVIMLIELVYYLYTGKPM